MADMKPPPPLECHPWYRNRVDQLWAWLNGPEESITIAVTPAVTIRAYLEPQESDPGGLRRLHLRKHRALGPAPYVGRPYRYVWNTAVDDNGRWIAGDSHIEYLPASIDVINDGE